MKIRYELLDKSKRKSPPSKVEGFGATRTNHMFVVDYENGQWVDARIVPYGDFNIAPGAIALHYGQSIFEGAKAFKHKDGEIYVWRFEENAKRMNHSADVTMMANIPVELQMEGLLRLLDVDRDWCPDEPESSMYLRPFMFATEDALGVRPANKYRYCIMMSPSGPYYKGGFNNAVTLLITKKYHRAVEGGTGTAKTGGNYAASLVPAAHAYKMGCAQVLYLDASNTIVEEAGTMNHYHVMDDGTFVIPTFSNTVLKSTTSLAVLDLAKTGKIKARQETVKLDQFLKDIQSGKIIEAGGFGTAAVVSPVGKYMFDDGSTINVGDGGVGKHSRGIYDLYMGMQTGATPAPEGWLTKVSRYPENK